MGKKAKKRSKSASSKMWDLAPCRAYLVMKRKVKAYIDQLQQYLLTLPWIVTLLGVRDRASGCLLRGILGFFGCVAPVWNFFFLRTQPKKIKLPIYDVNLHRFELDADN